MIRAQCRFFGLQWSDLRWLMDGVPGAVLGASAYGIWAVFSNLSHGWSIALRSGLVHALLSAGLTLYGTGFMRQIYLRAASPAAGALHAFGGGLMLTYLVLISTHLAIGTPHILMTLVAGILPNLAFCGSYALLLKKTFETQRLQRRGIPSIQPNP